MSRTVPQHVDSLGKLFNRIQLVAKEEVYYNGKRLMQDREGIGRMPVPVPKRIHVSPALLRQFTCVSGCTACCLPFTLDYTNDEFAVADWGEETNDQALDLFETREIEVNGKTFPVQSYPQYKDDKCPFLKPVREDGNLGCSFYPMQPLECAAAPQLLMTTRGVGTSVITKRPFGRGWAWKDKPQCEFDPVIDRIAEIPDTFDLSNEIGLLERYQGWAEYIEVETWIPEILEVLHDFPNSLRETELRSVVIECS